MVDFFLNNLGVIKNISLFLFSAVALAGLVYVYVKIFILAKKIPKINKEIETKQKELDGKVIDGIRGCYEITLGDPHGEEERSKKRIEQEIERLKRKKTCFLEEISIYKIFKK
ncbi:hypothetical protein KKG48_03280 [Patescibacteria group bacterium]|nr:hypothetical protein [Patescibacteria group bacterium]MCG2695049.1 hypothetical protein [Candidatus Parcubacteria bacterium]